MRTKYVWEKILSVSVGLMLYELAAGSSFYLMELSLVLLAGSFLLEERKLFVQLPRTITALEQELKRLCWVWIFLGLYLGWEIVTLSYSIYPEGVFDKYKVVFLMVCFTILILWYRQKGTNSEFLMDSRRKTLLFVFAVSAMTAAVLSVINISFPVLYPVLYGRRLSLRLDYNLFSQVVLFGLIAGETLIGARQENILCKKRLFLWLVCAPAVVLSSSRRNTIFLLCFFVWTVLYTAVKIKKEETAKTTFFESNRFLEIGLTVGSSADGSDCTDRTDADLSGLAVRADGRKGKAGKQGSDRDFGWFCSGAV